MPEVWRKVLSLKNKIKHGFVHKYLDDESKEKYEHMLEKREESS